VTVNSRVYATIEARMTSTRLPGKVLAEAGGRPMLELMIERVRRARTLDGIIVATTTNDTDDPVAELADRLGVGCYRGSEDDVLTRVLEAAQANDVDVIVELTGDNPLIDPIVIDRVVTEYQNNAFDYVSNILERSYPAGMDTEVFATTVLAEVADVTDDPADHEHVSLYIYRHPETYSLHNVKAPPAQTRPACRLTLDTPDDLKVIRTVFEEFLPSNPTFGLDDILGFLDRRPDIARLNAHVQAKAV
jgi:spore coat polysaccharide biosynthesis protein SpsF